MGGADLVVANSHAVADEIVRIYGRSAAVVAPCSSLDLDGPVEALASVEPGFVLVPVRPLGYKRFDVWLEAARRRPDLRFVHLGGGPHRAALFADAPDNIRSFGSVSEASLRWAYRNARAALTTCAEDFGLVPLEAAAHGLPMIAPDARGLRDHDPDRLTTYPFASVEGLLDALDRAPEPTGALDAERLGRARFTERMTALVDGLRAG